MNRGKIITIVALIAAILWVLAIADGARDELAKGDARLSSLNARLDVLTQENQRFSALSKGPASRRQPGGRPTSQNFATKLRHSAI